MANWTTILSFTLPHEAHFAKSLLESNEIDVILRDELTIQMDNFISNAIGGVKLQVRECDVESASTILKEGGYIKDHAHSQSRKIEIFKIKHKEQKAECPYCQSSNIAQNKQVNLLSIFLIFIIKAFLPFFKKHYHCFDCDKDWKFKIEK